MGRALARYYLAKVYTEQGTQYHFLKADDPEVISLIEEKYLSEVLLQELVSVQLFPVSRDQMKILVNKICFRETRENVPVNKFEVKVKPALDFINKYYEGEKFAIIGSPDRS